MISSMTGYGRGDAAQKGITATAELRSVNNRFLELTIRLPKNLSHRENDVKEIVQSKIDRGKINLSVNIETPVDQRAPMMINKDAARMSYKILNELKKSVNIKEDITIDHLLKFSEIIRPEDKENTGEVEWVLCEKAVRKALGNLLKMRIDEGSELQKDLSRRIKLIDKKIDIIEKLSKQRIPIERTRLRERVEKLIEAKDRIDDKRLELEIILLSEKLDITEECVRLRSHQKYFLESMNGKEPSGRKLNFLVQEIHREVNTIGSKANDAIISRHIIEIKEELEKIREQIQNIE
ncbi:MAG: YicC/YloC family endoribonuclease [Bacteroidota bacterium]|nr:YicC/YloC family endoribonuclease [Bacteroidota bacterium]